MITTVYISLFAFGLIYAGAVYLLHVNGLTESITALLVALGVTVTLGGCYVIETTTGIVTTHQVFFAFVCSGAPMIVGDIGAYLLRRRNGRKLLQDILEDHYDRPQGMA